MNNIIAKVRDIIGDQIQIDGSDFREFITSKVFTLSYSNVVDIKIYLNGSGSEWSSDNWEYVNGRIVVDEESGEELVPGEDVLEIRYSYYNKYSEGEIRGYVRSAIYHLVTEQYKTFTVRPPTTIFPTPDEREEDLIAIIASILIKGSIRSYRTPEITIVFSEDMSVEKKIKQVINQFDKPSPSIEYINPSKEFPEEEE